MDPVTHTLTGAALARAGLRRATPLATAALLIAANIPDIDVLAYVRGPEFALTFRRGWTHGVLALAVWPFVVAGLLMLFSRVHASTRPRVHVLPRFWPLVGVSAIGVATHPLLDWLNVYGLRWLMPFSGHWFYGDALFIVDPWVWALLAAGVWGAGRTAGRSARAALGGFAVYAVVMLAVAGGTEYAVARALTAEGHHVTRVLAGPEPINPFRRWIVAETDGVYRVGEYRVPGGLGDLAMILPGMDQPEVADAAATDAGRWFLSWVRFPLAQVDPDTVVILDARYALDEDAPFGIVKIPR